MIYCISFGSTHRNSESGERREGRGENKEAGVRGAALRAKTVTCLLQIRFCEKDGSSSLQWQQGGNAASGKSQIFPASLSTMLI